MEWRKVSSWKLLAELRPPSAADIQQLPKQASQFSASQAQELRSQAWAASPLLELLASLLPLASQLATSLPDARRQARLLPCAA
jgi:hypothetical protein